MTAHPSWAEPTAPLPPRQGRPSRLRAGDQDRHEAVLALSDHFAEGRLDQDEFDRRQTAALGAVYLDELDPLFADLPSVHRSPSVAPVSGPHQRAHRSGPPRGFLRVVAIIAFVWLVVMTRGMILLAIAAGFWFLHARGRAWRGGWDGRPQWERGMPRDRGRSQWDRGTPPWAGHRRW